jgi:anti-anti-sigma factor
MSGFEMHIAINATSSTMILSGEADLVVADEIVRQGNDLLCREYTMLLIVDLGGVTFVDSTTLGALIELRNNADAADKHLQLTRLPRRIRRVMDIAGLVAVFDVADGEQ